MAFVFYCSTRLAGLFKSFMVETEPFSFLSCFPEPARHNHIPKPHKSRLIMSCQQKTSRSKLHHRAASCTSTRRLQLLLCKLLARCIHIHIHIHIHTRRHPSREDGYRVAVVVYAEETVMSLLSTCDMAPCHMHMQHLLCCADIICDEVLHKICTCNGAGENGKRQNNNGIPLIFTPLQGEVPSQPVGVALKQIQTLIKLILKQYTNY